MTPEIEKACDIIRSRGIDSLRGAISTGSGQALPLNDAKIKLELSYSEIPGMDDPNIPGHEGVLRIVEGTGGNWAVWTGRRHFYQGHSHEETGYYIDISKALEARNLICINAAGGLDPDLSISDLLLIERYRNFIPIPGVLRTYDGGPWHETSGILSDRLHEAAVKCGANAGRGSYVGVPGPTYETAAEVAWLRSLGCHVVGMSTTPELERANEFGMKSTAISMVANVHGTGKPLSHEDVVKSCESGIGELGRLISTFLKSG